MSNIDYNLLQDLPLEKGDEWQTLTFQEAISDLDSINKELDSIAIDKIPFDWKDVIIIFGVATAEILMDFFFSDPSSNSNSIASQTNNSSTGLGKWLNEIHENISHTNNPIDFQGGFDINGNPIFHGDKSGIHKVISFGGGDHRERTYGHDLIRFWTAIKQYKEGKFIDGGYFNGEYMKVISEYTSKGKKLESLSLLDSIVAYASHMFADFFSSKGLPCPGWSFLSHSDFREVRSMAADLYKDGMNLRTEIMKGISVGIPEIFIRILYYLKYKGSDYSQEAIHQKRDLAILLSHSIATAVNIGKVVITKNPVSLNLTMIVRTLQMAWKSTKNQIDYNNRIISKVTLDGIRAQLELEKTMIIAGNGIYKTLDYQHLCNRLLSNISELQNKRRQRITELNDLRLQSRMVEKNLLLLMDQNNPLIKSSLIELDVSIDVGDSMNSLQTSLPIFIEDKEDNNIEYLIEETYGK